MLKLKINQKYLPTFVMRNVGLGAIALLTTSFLLLPSCSGHKSAFCQGATIVPDAMSWILKK